MDESGNIEGIFEPLLCILRLEIVNFANSKQLNLNANLATPAAEFVVLLDCL